MISGPPRTAAPTPSMDAYKSCRRVTFDQPVQAGQFVTGDW